MAVNGNYTALVQVKVSDRELERQLKKVGENIKPFNVKVKADGNDVNKLNENLKNTSREMNNTSNSAKNMSQSISIVNEETKSLGQTFLDTTIKVAKFGLSAKIIRTFQDSIVEAKDAIFEFDDAITDFKKVSDLTGDSLDNYTQKLGEMGVEVARTRKHFLRVYIVIYIKRTGLTAGKSLELYKLQHKK